MLIIQDSELNSKMAKEEFLMRFMDEVKYNKLYSSNKKIYAPINPSERKKGAAVMLLTRSPVDSTTLMNLPYIYNPMLFQGLYIDRNINAMIDSGFIVDDTENETVSEAMIHNVSNDRIKIKVDCQTSSTNDLKLVKDVYKEKNFKYWYGFFKANMNHVPNEVHVYVYKSVKDMAKAANKEALSNGEVVLNSYSTANSIHVVANSGFDSIKKAEGGNYQNYLTNELITYVCMNTSKRCSRYMACQLATSLSGQLNDKMMDKIENDWADIKDDSLAASYIMKKMYDADGPRELVKMCKTGDYTPLLKYGSRKFVKKISGLYEATLTADQRRNISDKDYGLPKDKKYPMPDESHVRSAIRFFNHVDPSDEVELAENIKKKIKQYNMTVKVGEDNRFSKYYNESNLFTEKVNRMRAIDRKEINKTISKNNRYRTRGVSRYHSITSGNAFESLAVSNPELFNTAKLLSLQTSENVVESFNAYLNNAIEAASNQAESIMQKARKQAEIDGDGSFFTAPRAIIEAQSELNVLLKSINQDMKDLKSVEGITDAECNRLISNAYVPGSLTEQGCRKLIDIRIKNNRALTLSLKNMLQLNYSAIGLTEDEAKTLLKDLENNETNAEAIGKLRNILKDPSILKNFRFKDNSYNFTSIGGGYLFLSDDEDVQFADHPSKQLENIFKYDAIVTAHGGYNGKSNNRIENLKNRNKAYNDLRKVNIPLFLKAYKDDTDPNSGNLLSKLSSYSGKIVVVRKDELDEKAIKDKDVDEAYDRYLDCKDKVKHMRKTMKPAELLNNEEYQKLKDMMLDLRDDYDDKLRKERNRIANEEANEIFKTNIKKYEVMVKELQGIKLPEKYSQEIVDSISKKINDMEFSSLCIPDSIFNGIEDIKRSLSDIKNSGNNDDVNIDDKWTIQPVPTLKKDNISTAVELLRQLKAEGFKNVLLTSCNPGSVQLPKDIKDDNDFNVTAGMFSVYKESIEIDDVEKQLSILEQELDKMLEEEGINPLLETSLDELLEEYNYLNEQLVLNEGVLDALKAIAKKAVQIIIAIWKKIVQFFGFIWKKIKEFFVGKPTEKATKEELKKEIEISAISIQGGKAKVEKKKVKNLEEAQKFVSNATASISNFIKNRSNRETAEIKKIETSIEQGKIKPNNKQSSNTNESVIFDESHVKNGEYVEFNMDLWKPNTSTNVLYITGLSGSGKSTLGRKLAKENKAQYISLDHYTSIARKGPDHLNKKIEENSWEDIDILKKYFKNEDYCYIPDGYKANGIRDIPFETVKLYFNKFFDWLNVELRRNKNKLYIVEGIHIYAYTNYEFYANQPIICIVGGPLKAFIRRMKRGYNERIDRDGDSSAEALKYIFKDAIKQSIPMYTKEAPIIRKFTNDLIDIDESTLLESNRNITVKTINTTNPNDSVSSKAVKVTFYDSNEKIGEASASAIDTNEAFLYDVEVFEKYRGQGYGNDIISYMLKHYKINELTVEKTNTIAINLYKKFGFKIVKEFEENGKPMFDMKLKTYKNKSTLLEVKFENDKGEKVPKICPKCGSKVGVFFRGEPVFLCTNKKCEKYFGTVPFKEAAILNESYYISIPKNDKEDIKDIIDTFTDSEKEDIGGYFFDKYNTVYYDIEYDGSNPIGFIAVVSRIKGPHGFVMLGVKKDYRGKGIAKKLANKMLEEFKISGKCSTLTWNVSFGNTASEKVAKSVGFKFYKKYNTYNEYYYDLRESMMESSIEKIPLPTRLLTESFNEDGYVMTKDYIMTDNFITFFNGMDDQLITEAEKKYDSRLKRYLFKERMKNNKTVLLRYQEMKVMSPWIKKTFLKLPMYQRKNIFIDLSYYHGLFLEHLQYKKDAAIKMYWDFINRLINDSEYKSLYNKITIYIPVYPDAWDTNNAEELMDYKKSINPISMIIRMLRMNPDELKKWGDKDIIFLSPKGYFKINFNNFQLKDLAKFKRFITKLVNNEDIEDDDEEDGYGQHQKETDSPAVITANIADKIEKNMGVKIDDITGGGNASFKPKEVEEALPSTVQFDHLRIRTNKINLPTNSLSGKTKNSSAILVMAPSDKDTAEVITKSAINNKFLYSSKGFYKP